MICIIRKIAAITFVMIFLSAFSAYADEVKVPIILYHNLLESIDGENALVNITPETFREHMTAIKAEGYTAITYNDYYEYLSKGTLLPEKPIIITFDDGYLSNYEKAFPILRELGLKATIFVVTSTVGATTNVSYPHFTWMQALEMEQSGVIKIESHSHSHLPMSQLEFGDIVREVRLSKYLIEKNLNKECSFLAYPFGDFSDVCLKIAREAGYSLQNKVGDRGFNSKNTDNELLRRITVWGNISGGQLTDIINQNLNSQ